MVSPTLKLSNGVEIPAIGFGPMIMGYGHPALRINRWNIPLRIANKLILRRQKYNHFVSAIASAVRNGFRLIDYATAYGNLAAIGDAIVKSEINRKDVFLTGRIWNPSQYKGETAIREEIKDILLAYKTDYLDLLMFHWPVPGRYLDTWAVICEAYEKGICRSIGVSNCHVHHLQALMQSGLPCPMVNQIEIHPLFTQKPLVRFCQENNIQIEAYTPLARMDDRLFRLPVLQRMAERHSKTKAQIVLRWHVQNGIVPCVRSLSEERQLENLNIFDFQLSNEEIRQIDSININSRLRFDPDNCDYSIL